MLNIKPIEDYRSLIKTGLTVPPEIHLLFKNIIDPLLKTDPYFDEQTFEECLDYCEAWYYPLFPYQKFIYALYFLYDDSTKLRVCFDEFLIMMGRGNGKDGMLAPLADFLTTPMHGINKYNIEIIANSEKQAKGTYEIIYDRMTKNYDVASDGFKISMEDITNLDTGSIISFNSGNPKTGDGRRPGMIIVNEIHEMENYDLISVYQSARGKVQNPRTTYITTDGKIRMGVLDDFKEFAKQRLNGEIPNSRFCPIIFKLSNEAQVDDPKNWPMANPSLDYMPVLKDELHSAFLKMRIQPHLEYDFYVKRMNLPREPEEKVFVDFETIKATNRPIPEKRGFPAIFALDYAEIRDFMSVGFLSKVGEEFVWEQHSWVNRRSPKFKHFKPPLEEWAKAGHLTIVDTPIIDPDMAFDYFFKHCGKYNTKLITMDMFRFGVVRDSAEKRGLTIFDPKSNPYGEIHLIRSGEITDNLIIPQMEEIFANKRIIYGDDPLMRWYTNNTGVEQTKKGNKNFIKIEAKLRKNDGFQALRHAFVKADFLEDHSWEPLL